MSALAERLQMLRASYDTARDAIGMVEWTDFTRGIRAGLQVAIDGIDAELRLIAAEPEPARLRTDNVDQRWVQHSAFIDTDNALQVTAEAVRGYLVDAVSEGCDLLRKNGHVKSAEARERAALEICHVDLTRVLEQVAGGPLPDHRDEARAFQQAAYAARMNVARIGGQFAYQPGRQALQVWSAAVRWARGQADQDSGTGA